MNFYNPTEQPARIRFYHAGVTAQPVDVYLNDQMIARGLNYRQMTKFIPIPQGMYSVKVYLTSSNNLLVSRNINVEGSKLITISQDGDKFMLIISDDTEPLGYCQESMMPQMMQPGMMGEQQGLPQPMYGQSPQQYPINPNIGEGSKYYSMNPNLGQYGCQIPQVGYSPYQMPIPKPIQNEKRDGVKGRVGNIRFLHFSPNLPAVDVTLQNGQELFSQVPYMGVTEFIEMAPGTYTFQIRNATGQILLTIPNVVINPLDVKSIHLVGLLNATPMLEAVIVNETMIS